VIQDCESALRQDSQNVKAFHLKGIAFIEQGKKVPLEIEEITKGLNLLINGRKDVEKKSLILLC